VHTPANAGAVQQLNHLVVCSEQSPSDIATDTSELIDRVARHVTDHRGGRCHVIRYSVAVVEHPLSPN
jgi:hypothetical protein